MRRLGVLHSASIALLAIGGTGSAVAQTITTGAPALLAAVLPSSRSVMVNTPATAFATIINSGGSTATACGIAPNGSAPVSFVYQTTDPKTNAATGTPNAPVDIAAGGSQSFLIALTPTAPFGATVIAFKFFCSNAAAAPSQTGLNTLLISASTTPIPDIVALAATTKNDGVLHLVGTSGAFSVATINLGAASAITVTLSAPTVASPIGSIPPLLLVCQTDPAIGNCTPPLDQSVTTIIGTNQRPTFNIFDSNVGGAVPFDPANIRLTVTFTDAGGVVRGSTSVAVTTQ